MVRGSGGALLILWTIAFLSGPALNQQKSTPVEQFHVRVEDYLKLRKTAASELPKPKPTPSAEEIEQRKALLTSTLAAARTGVAQGSIFTPAVAAEFRRLGKLAMDGADGPRVQKSLKRAEPVQIAVRANQAYPPAAPLQSMPPTLLMGLPELPKELEYRLVGKTLVLRDIEANLIVDFLPEAIP